MDVWRALSPTRAIRYNCVQNLRTGRFCVWTADFVEPSMTSNADQERYFVERVLDWSLDDPEQPDWFESVEAAIAAHDADFGN